MKVESLCEVLALVVRGDRQRVFKATDFNHRSNRAHTILQVPTAPLSSPNASPAAAITALPIAADKRLGLAAAVQLMRERGSPLCLQHCSS